MVATVASEVVGRREASPLRQAAYRGQHVYLQPGRTWPDS